MHSRSEKQANNIKTDQLVKYRWISSWDGETLVDLKCLLRREWGNILPKIINKICLFAVACLRQLDKIISLLFCEIDDFADACKTICWDQFTDLFIFTI